MQIKQIKAHNYKTYLDLCLDLSVTDPNRPIILIGGENGGGKTTLFEAIYGALYGLKIENADHFQELLNAGALASEKPEIVLEIVFTGWVAGSEKKYVLRRTYKLNDARRPLESVYLNMDGCAFSYGTATPPSQRAENEEQINKIIKANLPEELSRYFLFDAMKSSQLLDAGVFSAMIRDNVENVMGFKKYQQLRQAVENIQQQKAKERLEAEQEAKEYEDLCNQKKGKEKDLEDNAADQERLNKLLIAEKDNYEAAKAGATETQNLQLQIDAIDGQIKDIQKRAKEYEESLKNFTKEFEKNASIPYLAAEMANEIDRLLKVKEQARKNGASAYTQQMVDEIIEKAVAHLKELQLLPDSVKAADVAAYIMSVQKSKEAADEYAYLDEDEVRALADCAKGSFTNLFLTLDNLRPGLNTELESVPDLQKQKETLQTALVKGNDALINQYDGWKAELQQLKMAEDELKGQIEVLKKRINTFDIQVQQQPDKKYDTLVKLEDFFRKVTDQLLQTKKTRIEQEMQQALNRMLLSYEGQIDRVVLADSMENFNIKMYHKAGNPIALSQLNTASKQIFIQVLLKVLRSLGDYNPPVMIDTVMGVLSEKSRDFLMEEYFPDLAEQTILLCTTTEIRPDSDYEKLEPFIAKTYTLQRSAETQSSEAVEGYFGTLLK